MESAELIDDIRRVAEGVNYLSASKYRERGKYTTRTVQTTFGSWANAKREADLPVRQCGRLERLTLKQKKKKTDQIKDACGCAICGFDEYTCSLQFHHYTDDKVESVGQMVHSGYLWETIKAELRKCVVVCANCHSAITNNAITYQQYRTATAEGEQRNDSSVVREESR